MFCQLYHFDISKLSAHKCLMLNMKEKWTFPPVWFRKSFGILDSLIHNLNIHNSCPDRVQNACGSLGRIFTDKISWNSFSMDSIGTVRDRTQLQIIMRTSVQFLLKPWPCPIDLEETTVTRAASAVCQRRKPPRDRKTKRVSQWGRRDLEVCWQVLVSAERILWGTKGIFCVCPRDGRKQARNNALSQRQQMYNWWQQK